MIFLKILLFLYLSYIMAQQMVKQKDNEVHFYRNMLEKEEYNHYLEVATLKNEIAILKAKANE